MSDPNASRQSESSGISMAFIIGGLVVLVAVLYWLFAGGDTDGAVAPEAAVESVEGAADTATDAVEGAAETATDAVEGAADAATDSVEGAADAATDTTTGN